MIDEPEKPAEVGPTVSPAAPRDDKAATSRSRGTRLPPTARARGWNLLIVATTAVAFLPVVGNGWVDRDDTKNFLENPYYRGIGPAQLRWAFTTFYLGVYQPVAWVLLETQYEVSGLLPWSYHLASLAMHCGNSVVLMALAAAVSRAWARARPTLANGLDDRARTIGAAAAALLFAVHPLRVEVVAWASCQPYLPCALFAMLAAIAYLRRAGASPAGRVRWLAAAWALYFLAMLCKAAALTLPLAFVLLDVFVLRRFSGETRPRRAMVRAALLDLLPFVGVALLFLALTIGGKYTENPAMVREESFSLGPRLARASYSAGFYVRKTVWPAGLSAVYEWSEKLSASGPWFAGTAVAAAALTLIAAAVVRRLPGPAATWFAYLALLAPVSAFVRPGYTVVADRYAYIATIPWFIALSHILARGWEFFGQRKMSALAASIALATLIGGLGSVTWRLSRTWRDSESLFARAALVGALSRPSQLLALGKIYEGRQQLDDAESSFRQAQRLAPTRADVTHALGAYLSRRGKPVEALAWFERTIMIDPRFVAGYNGLGSTLAQQGKLGLAETQFEAALRLEPWYLDARLNLALLLRTQRKWAAAAEHYTLILHADPNNVAARSGLDAIASELAQSNSR